MDWINVKLCLPEPFVSVLCYAPGEKPLPTVREGYITKDGKWVVAFLGRYHTKITLWAKMPTFLGDDENEN
mgnify:CR=1 FL=1